MNVHVKQTCETNTVVCTSYMYIHRRTHTPIYVYKYIYIYVSRKTEVNIPKRRKVKNESEVMKKIKTVH